MGCLRALLTFSWLRKLKRGSIKTREIDDSAEKRGAPLPSGVRLLPHGPRELCSHTRSIIRLKLASPTQPFETGGLLWETLGTLDNPRSAGTMPLTPSDVLQGRCVAD